jgi:uncharacterized protein (DUF2141 family)
MKKILLVMAASAFTFAVQAHAFDLTVEITNPKSEQGWVAAAVYAGADGWLKDGAALKAERAAAGAKTVLVFRGLPAGRYAVSAYHDENGNGKLDRNLVGLPIERYGMSRDARGTMGPPSFDAAAIELGADTTIGFQLN